MSQAVLHAVRPCAHQLAQLLQRLKAKRTVRSQCEFGVVCVCVCVCLPASRVHVLSVTCFFACADTESKRKRKKPKNLDSMLDVADRMAHATGESYEFVCVEVLLALE